MVGEFDDNPEVEGGKIIVQHPAEDDLTVSTRDVPDYIPNLEEPIGIDGNTILLMLPGQSAPLTFTDIPSIILGRYDQSTGIYPTVDLTPFFGKSLGVSRRHAEIFSKDGRFYVRDLESANGTFLNNKKISHRAEMIKSGDQIRLGELLIVVFLSEKDKAQAVLQRQPLAGQQTLYLQYQPSKPPSPPDSISIEFMSQTLSGYLHALSEIQATILSANKQDNQPVTISSFQVVDKLNIIEVQLYIHSQVLSFMRDAVQKRITQSGEVVSPILYQHAAQDILAEMTSLKMNDELYEAYLERLMRYLKVLFAHPLKMVNITK